MAFASGMKIPTSLIIAITLLCAACATKPTQNGQDADARNSTQKALDKTSAGVGNAATAPLVDLNIKREQIPALLKEIRNPYNVDPAIDCTQIAARVEALNAVLGRDWDIPPPDKKSLEERATDGASTALLDTVASEASGLIPYRGLVRTVSGANRHKKKVFKAYERGSHRRTYLKGIGIMKGCPSPASPIPMPEEADKVVFK